MKLEKLLSRLPHRQVYSPELNSNVFLKSLSSDIPSVIVPDTNCLVSSYNFLQDFLRVSSDKSTVIHQVHGQVKALKELGLQDRLKVLPIIKKEYESFSKSFTELIVKYMFKYSQDREIGRGLFNLYCDVRDLRNSIDDFVDEDLENRARYLLNEVNISSQLVSFYSKGNEAKLVSEEDKLLYLASIISNQDSMSEGKNTCILTADTDILVQPRIVVHNMSFGVPVYFPSKYRFGGLPHDSYERFVHRKNKGLNSSQRRTVVKFGNNSW